MGYFQQKYDFYNDLYIPNINKNQLRNFSFQDCNDCNGQTIGEDGMQFKMMD